MTHWVIRAILPHFSHVRLSTDRVENRKNLALGMNPQRCRLCVQVLLKRAPSEISLRAQSRRFGAASE
jgi:hypothetical protein